MQTFHSLETDLKAEMLAASLLDDEDDISRIIIERLGINPRSHTKDVTKVYEDVGQANLNRQLVIQSFRQSIYDAVPQNLFHPVTLGGIGKNSEEIIEEIQLQRRKEAEARKFFSPFEQEASYLEMHALAIELMLERKGKYDNLLRLFEQAWPVLRKLPRATRLTFVYLLPILREMRGDRRWTESCFSYILGFSVRINTSYTTDEIDDGLGSFTTGRSQLGIDSSFGGAQYDGHPRWDIKVGPIPQEQIARVLPHTDFYQLLLILSEYFIPASVFVSYAIISSREQPTVLENGEQAARLDYTFFL